MLEMFRLLFLFSVIFLVDSKNEEYMGHKVYNLKVTRTEQVDRLGELKGDLIDFWRRPSLKHKVVGKVMVPPSQTDWFEKRLEDLDIEKDVAIEDIYEYLKEIDKSMPKTSRNDEDRVFGYDAYYRYDEILAHINALAEAYSDSPIRITVDEFGRTENNRSVVYLTITDTLATQADKPVVIIESGIIPRQWITIPSALNIVNRLLDNENDFLSKADWIIVPVVNPDGYEYTHTNLRLWQKSLSTQSNQGFICPGVNINRNFDVDWGVSDSSSTSCSHLYAGVSAFSEVESQMLKFLVETYNRRIRFYLSLQNGAGFVSYPWQYERAASGMFRQHLFLGLDMINAMTDDYILDVGWSALGDRASGTGSDFAQQNGVLYSLNIDVVPRGADGVNIPETEIVEVIEDVWRGVEVVARTVLS